jgi:hypothetical protein
MSQKAMNFRRPWQQQNTVEIWSAFFSARVNEARFLIASGPSPNDELLSEKA